MSEILRKALFLDRDGVINLDHGYVHRREQFEFCPGIFDLVGHARSLGFGVVVVTNQAGIGRGLYSVPDFERLTDWMLEQFAACAAPIDGVYFCPDHPEHGLGCYRRDTEDRKPGPGMLLRAARDLSLDLSKSIMVGDHETDIIAGIRAGVSLTILFARRTVDPTQTVTRADLVVTSLDQIKAHLN